MISPAFIQTLLLFVLMLIGFGAGKMRMLDEGTARGLSRLLVNFIIPALIIESMQRPFSLELRDLSFLMIAVSTLAYVIALVLAPLVVWLLKGRGKERGALIFCAVFSNCGFMGFPVVEALMGKSAIFSAAVANVPFNLLAFSVGPLILARASGSEAKLSLSSILNPAVLASVLGFLLFAFNIVLPSPLTSLLGYLGDMTTPLSMLLVGSIISRMNLRSAIASPRVYAISIYRLALLPAILFGVLYALGFRSQLLAMPVILAAMPAAANAAILAEAYGGDAETASSMILVSTLLSLVSIPLMATLQFPAR